MSGERTEGRVKGKAGGRSERKGRKQEQIDDQVAVERFFLSLIPETCTEVSLRRHGSVYKRDLYIGDKNSSPDR